MEGRKDWRRREAEDETLEETALDEATVKLDTDGFEGLEPMASGNWGLGYEQSRHVKEPNREMVPEKKRSQLTAPRY